ncbi:hypothetical protein GCM10022406_11300 [Hymenobacter algoricola]|uniref:Uncharacterized protein n=1 Tax=Hymenobacter algoricola TaxID=486267 RepID=A0ABP7MRY7_9BACT
MRFTGKIFPRGSGKQVDLLPVVDWQARKRLVPAAFNLPKKRTAGAGYCPPPNRRPKKFPGFHVGRCGFWATW